MDKVVYFLGAGFSAPLGLPVTNNFLVKSKDMYAADSHFYAHFSEVFKTIKELSIIKNYYQADLFNIEEILSILDMGQDPDGSVRDRYDDFINFQYYNFFSRTAQEYLEIVKANSRGGADKLVLNKLETAHRSFCNR